MVTVNATRRERRALEERRARNARDEKRWRKQKPRYTITNAPDHPGLHDASYKGWPARDAVHSDQRTSSDRKVD